MSESVHIKSKELCDRCAYSIRRCMIRWDEEGRQCEGCKMNCGLKGTFKASPEAVDKKTASAPPENWCVCDSIMEGTPCEFFKEIQE